LLEYWSRNWRQLELKWLAGWAVSGNTNSNNAGAAIPLLRIQRSKIRKPWVKRQPLRPEKRWQ
jgi:hypothetical protein